MIRRILSKFTQDYFRNDWYGWMTNQISHIVLGFVMVFAMSSISLMVVGEIPYKWAIWLSCAGIYAIFEGIRGWSLDALEDWVFVVVYGAGLTVLSFTEIAVGSPVVQSNVLDFAWLVIIPLAHLGFGIWRRVSDD